MKIIFVPWRAMPETMKNYYEQHYEYENEILRLNSFVTPDELFEMIITAPLSERIAMLIANLADLASYHNKKNSDEFLNFIVKRVKSICDGEQ